MSRDGKGSRDAASQPQPEEPQPEELKSSQLAEPEASQPEDPERPQPEDPERSQPEELDRAQPEMPEGSDRPDGQLSQRFREGLDEMEARMSPRWQSRTRRFRERIRAQPLLDTAWRVGVFALGATLLAAGVVMFVFPGPGWATIILGLVVLASEFAWASRALDPVKAAARRASEVALDPKRRKRNLTLAALAGVACAIALVWYLTVYGATLAPLLATFQSIVDRIVAVFR